MSGDCGLYIIPVRDGHQQYQHKTDGTAHADRTCGGGAARCFGPQRRDPFVSFWARGGGILAAQRRLGDHPMVVDVVVVVVVVDSLLLLLSSWWSRVMG